MLDESQRNLSTSEVREAIASLSDADWVRLKKIAFLGANKCGLSSEDLLQEVFIKALSGERRCPKDVKIVRFLSESMRSIVSSNAKAYKRHPEVSLQASQSGTGTDCEIVVEDMKLPSTESVAIARLDIEKVREVVPKLFESDSEAVQYLAMGIVDGLDTTELQEVSGLRGKEYNSARRLFRRRIEKAFSGGWENG